MITFLAACLRGDAPVWPRELSARAFLEQAGLHGVHGLLHDVLHGGRTLAGAMPDQVAESLLRWSRLDAARELLVPEWIAGLLVALEARDVPCLILKGTALAYSLYRHPHLRPRADVDLLVPEHRRTTAREVLAALGYTFPNATSGRLVSAEYSATQIDRHGIERNVDLHWRLSNAQGFARAASFETLLERAVALPALAPGALGPSRADALLIACLHRVAHRHSDYWYGARRHRGDRLIWVHDVHLLASELDTRGWTEFCRRADAAGLRAVCLDGLCRAKALLDTRIPTPAASQLQAGGDEITAAYLRGGALRWLATDLRALPNWSNRLRLLAEHVFPPRAYMLTRYGCRSNVWLPALYLHRASRGAWRWLLGR
jgi:hypothetical protein